MPNRLPEQPHTLADLVGLVEDGEYDFNGKLDERGATEIYDHALALDISIDLLVTGLKEAGVSAEKIDRIKEVAEDEL